MSKQKNSPRKSKKSPENTVDDRNLVATEESTIEVTLEERVMEFWQNNKGMVLFGIVAVIAVLGGIEVSKVMRQQEIQAMQEVYTSNEDELMAFADQYSDEPLAGVAYLLEADKQYVAEDYVAAAANYSKAAKALKEGPVAARASIGLGVCHIKSGNELGVQVLTGLMEDANQLGVIRSEAAYHLAFNALGKDQFAAAREYLNVLQGIDFQGVWSMKAMSLETLLEQAGYAAPEPEVEQPAS